MSGEQRGKDVDNPGSPSQEDHGTVSTDVFPQTGQWARLQNLQSRPVLNGQLCRVSEQLREKDRWAVRICSTGEVFSVKPASLTDSSGPDVVAGAIRMQAGGRDAEAQSRLGAKIEKVRKH